jgi:hypothetical protein
MDDLVLWTCVVGGTPLALALILRGVEWSLGAVRAGTVARGSAARERHASDTSISCMHF